ncbi:30S ribosomal protein S5 [Candidatus Woesearchaeota archaeon]|jgi:small subunit ribosomal protein S5|nr:30S ribosomal protein S5 [Candidatus Woesearchaeota archaeon]
MAKTNPQNKKGRFNRRDSNRSRAPEERVDPRENWKPKTQLGHQVKDGTVVDINEIFDSGERILEAEIVEVILPDLKSDLLLIGQAKGKFGGGQRRIFRQTQKKTREGNKIKFTTCALVGNENGYFGVSFGKSKETVPARDKSIRKAKLGLTKIRRGCGSWACNCGTPHSIPFTIEGKCGSTIVKLMPAPKGNGLCVEKECAKILKLAGIKDVLSKTKGQTKTKVNLIKALLQALSKLGETKIKPDHIAKLGLVEGHLKEVEREEVEEIKEDKKDKKEK